MTNYLGCDDMHCSSDMNFAHLKARNHKPKKLGSPFVYES